MTEKQKQQVARATKLSESDQAWQTRFTSRPDVLLKLLQEARDDHQAGRTEPIEDLFK